MRSDITLGSRLSRSRSLSGSWQAGKQVHPLSPRQTASPQQPPEAAARSGMAPSNQPFGEGGARQVRQGPHSRLRSFEPPSTPSPTYGREDRKWQGNRLEEATCPRTPWRSSADRRTNTAPEIGRQMRAMVLEHASFIRDLYPSWINEFLGKQQDEGSRRVRGPTVPRMGWRGHYRPRGATGIVLASSSASCSRRARNPVVPLSGTPPPLSSFWRWLIRRGHLETEVNPWRGHELGTKSKRTDRKALPDEALLKLLEARYGRQGQTNAMRPSCPTR